MPGLFPDVHPLLDVVGHAVLLVDDEDAPRTRGRGAGATLTRYRSRVRVIAGEADAPLPALPRCRDRDDEKFLQLAARVGASWLVSKDKQVLSLADRHGLPFSIQSPRQAVERMLAAR